MKKGHKKGVGGQDRKRGGGRRGKRDGEMGKQGGGGELKQLRYIFQFY